MTEWMQLVDGLVFVLVTILIVISAVVLEEARDLTDNGLRPPYPVQGIIFIVFGVAMEVPIEGLREAGVTWAETATATTGAFGLPPAYPPAVLINWAVQAAILGKYVALTAGVFIIAVELKDLSEGDRGFERRASHRRRDDAHPTSMDETTSDRRGAPSRTENTHESVTTGHDGEPAPDGGIELAAEADDRSSHPDGGPRG